MPDTTDIEYGPVPAPAGSDTPVGGGVLESVAGFLGGPIGAAVGSIGSGLFGQRSARKARQYQEALDNSRYQRAADDMQKAGLNRILALGSPATSFSGGSGQMPDVGSSLVGGSEQRRKGKLVNAELAALNTQVSKNISEQNVNSAVAAKAWADRDLSEANKSFTNQQREESAARTELYQLQKASAKAEADMWNDAGETGKWAQYLLQLLSGSAKGVRGL